MLRSEITIIITTYNRYDYLKRLLCYYINSGIEYSILVLDSSSNSCDDFPLRDLLEADNINWLKYNSDIFIVEKINDGVQHVVTPFAVLCADDDFLIIESIEKCASYLQGNDSYASAHGIYVHHSLNLQDQYKNKSVDWGVMFRESKSVNHNSPLKRIQYFLPNNYPSYPFYAVHRSAALKEIWQKTSESVHDWGWSEIFPSCASIIIGKHKKLNILYSSREVNSLDPFDTARYSKMFTLEKNSNAICGLSELLFKYGGVEAKQSNELISSLIKMYLDRGKSKKRRASLNKNRFLFYILSPMSLYVTIKCKLIEKYFSLKKSGYALRKIHGLVIAENLDAAILNETRQDYENN